MKDSGLTLPGSLFHVSTTLIATDSFLMSVLAHCDAMLLRLPLAESVHLFSFITVGDIFRIRISFVIIRVTYCISFDGQILYFYN